MYATFAWPAEDGTALTVTVRWNGRRRTRMGLEFAPAGTVLVDAPPGASLDEVRRLLRRNASWVCRRSRAVDGAWWYPAVYVDGAELLLYGRKVTLRIGAGAVRLADATTLVAPPSGTKAAVWAWWTQQAGALLEQALADAAARLPWLPALPPWRHRYMTSRWGSCSSRGRISLNTHLPKLAPPLVAYVVCHELCHLRRMDHGPAFYALLEASLPDWRERRRALHRYGAVLREPRPG